MSKDGRIALVTGATDGLGREVARRLAKAGFKVLVHGRNRAKAEAMREELGADRAEVVVADLASLDEVRAMARAIRAAHPALQLLVNNAGVGLFGQGAPRQVSRDGHELHFAVNYLAHVLLTLELLPALRAGAPSRIVNVSSIGQAPIDFADVMLERSYSGYQGYTQSKLAQVMFTFDLAARLKGSGVSVTALHPATFMDTGMVLGQGLQPRSSVHEGADAVMRLATSPEVEGVTGAYFNQLQEARASDQAYDADARRRLWELSLDLTGAAAP